MSATALVTVYNEDTWSATSDQPWLLIAGPIDPDERTLTMTAQRNRGAARSATITVVSDGGHTATIRVTQSGG
ncbi:MAG: hypothetical protein LBH48_04730 [Bifidobacteriaceae bacterium]|jgi:hypothetical protein|nr:hypothetical protein [Bifidobacteriaceae bacterium]